MGLQSGGEDCHALWSPSNRFVAISERVERHSRVISVLALSPDIDTQKVELPDHVQNALGRIGATQVDFACISKPKVWHGDDLVLELYFTAKGRISYTCEVTLGFTMEERSQANVELKKVTKPIGQGGWVVSTNSNSSSTTALEGQRPDANQPKATPWEWRLRRPSPEGATQSWSYPASSLLGIISEFVITP